MAFPPNVILEDYLAQAERTIKNLELLLDPYFNMPEKLIESISRIQDDPTSTQKEEVIKDIGAYLDIIRNISFDMRNDLDTANKRYAEHKKEKQHCLN